MNRVVVDKDHMYFYQKPKDIPESQLNFSTIEFMMDSSWKELTTVVAQFIQGDMVLNKLVVDGLVFVPTELRVGSFQICLRGDKDGQIIGTVNRLQLRVVESFRSDGETPVPPTPDLYQQLLFNLQKPPDIGDNGNWFAWDVESNEYKDTGKPSRGEKGETGGGGAMTDDDILECLIAADMLAAVSDFDGAIFTDENSKILLM